tara:strand:+ start:631 stop:1680 length:1050 start_codon:yes stop_codon:yes gene_type:complete
MGLFDGQGLGGPAPTNVADMYRGVGRTIGKGLIDPAMESRGFKSEENQVIEIMKGVDLTDAKSVSDTFNRIMEINPQAAAEFQKQVMPMLEANQAATISNTKGTFQKQLETAANILSCDLTDADCKKEAYALVKDYKRENKWDSGSANALVDDMISVQAEGAKTGGEIAKITQMLEILPQIYTGWGAGAWQEANRVGAMFGLPAATAEAGQMEIFAQGGMEAALKYIEQTKGAISDREFEAFLASAPGLYRTKAGNEMMLNTALQYAKFNQKKAIEQNRWIKEQRDSGKTPLLEDWSAHLAEWAAKSENIIKLPTEAAMQEAGKQIVSSDEDVQTQESVEDMIEAISRM